MLTEASQGNQRAWLRTVGLFFLAWALNYANRTVLSPLLLVIGGAWGLGHSQLGLFNSWFFLVYTLVQIPMGLVADRIGHKRTLLSFYSLQAVGALSSALAWGPGSFAAARVVTGLGQSSSYLTQYSLAAAAIPDERRAFGNSIINSGMGVGMTLGFVLSSVLVHGLGYGWRVPFMVLGVATVTVLIVLRRQLQSVPEVWGNKGDERNEKRKGSGPLTPSLLMALIPLFLQSFCSNYGFFALLTWLPSYLEATGRVSGLQAGLVSAMVPLTSIPGSLMAAWVSDWGKHNGRFTRKHVMAFLVVVAAVGFWLVAVCTEWAYVMVGLIGVGLFGFMALDPLTITLVSQLTPRELRGTVFGMKNFFTMSAAVASPYVTGYLADLTGGFQTSFYVAGLIELVAVLCLLGIKEPVTCTQTDHW